MILPFVTDADACPVCGVDHAQLDDFRCCPDHGHELQRYGANLERDQYKCPVRGCHYERWIRRPPPRKEPPPMTTTPARPTSEIALRPDQTFFDKYQLGVLGIADAPNLVLRAFFHRCAQTALDPFANQISLINFGGEWSIVTEIDGHRIIGQRAARRENKIVSRKAPIWFDADEQPHRIWTRTDIPPSGCEFTLIVDGQPNTAVVSYNAFVRRHGPYLKGGKPNPKAGEPMGPWKTMPDHKIAICAEAQAWRSVFPNDFLNAPSIIGDAVVMPTADPTAAATTWHAAAVDEPPTPARVLVETVQAHWERLGITDLDEQTSLTAALIGDDFIADTFTDFSHRDLVRVADQIGHCKDIGQVHALIDHGDKPGSP